MLPFLCIAVIQDRQPLNRSCAAVLDYVNRCLDADQVVIPVAEIAQATQFTERTVRSALHHLVCLGLISRRLKGRSYEYIPVDGLE